MKSITINLVAAIFLACFCITAVAENLIDSKISKESGWGGWIEKSAKDAGGLLTIQDGKVVVKSPAIEKQGQWKVQIIKMLEIDADKSYKLKFKANVDKSGKISIGYILSKEPYTVYGSAEINVVEGEKDYECTIAVKKDKNGKYDSPRSLRFYLGDLKDATFTLSDVSFEEVK